MGKPVSPMPEGPAARRSFVTLPLAQLLPALTRPAFKKRSPAGATLQAEWSQIVGSALAALSEPRRLNRGELTIACTGAVALELQHLQAALMSRINIHAGEALVTKLRFVQDHVLVHGKAARPVRHVDPEPIDGVGGPLGDALASLLQSMRERD